MVLTEADARDYTDLLPSMDTPVTVLRNALPWDLPPESGPRTARTVVAAGRLVPEKGFDRLVDAWAPVAAAHPGWALDIHGEGALRRSLQERIDRAGLADVVRLRGYTADIGRVFSEASLFVMSSRREGFPMVLLEAMSTGLPLVAMDCPRGPGEIVTPANGLLVPDGDVVSLGAALADLVGDAPSPAFRSSPTPPTRGYAGSARRAGRCTVHSTTCCRPAARRCRPTRCRTARSPRRARRSSPSCSSRSRTCSSASTP
ncbi:MAG: glycosyltransferase [Nocardioides sp.]|nr:glycosyltransferase [Nocardioides sp.]